MYAYELNLYQASRRVVLAHSILHGRVTALRAGSEMQIKNSLAVSAISASAIWHRSAGRLQSPGAGASDLGGLQRIATKVRFPRNRTIFNDGDEAAFTYQIVSGVVRLCKHTVHGRRLVTHFLFPGDYFGFMQLGAYSFAAEAVTDIGATCYPRRQLETLCEQDPLIRNKFHGLLMNQMLGTQDHMLLLGCLSAEERVSSFIIWNSERMGSQEVLAKVPMSRQDIADYLGLTVETVCRALSKLKRAGVLKFSRPTRMVNGAGGLAATATAA